MTTPGDAGFAADAEIVVHPSTAVELWLRLLANISVSHFMVETCGSFCCSCCCCCCYCFRFCTGFFCLELVQNFTFAFPPNIICYTSGMDWFLIAFLFSRGEVANGNGYFKKQKFSAFRAALRGGLVFVCLRTLSLFLSHTLSRFCSLRLYLSCAGFRFVTVSCFYFAIMKLRSCWSAASMA